MRFTWNATKRRRNLEKHGIDLQDVPAVFSGMTLTMADDRAEYGEERWITVGVLKTHVIVVAHTETDDVIRIISARKATRYEEKNYFEKVGN